MEDELAKDKELAKYVGQHEAFIDAIHTVIFNDVKKRLILPIVKRLDRKDRFETFLEKLYEGLEGLMENKDGE